MSELCTRCSQPTDLIGGHLTEEECARYRWAPSLRLWPWAEAPEQYRVLSNAGGDEVGLLFCPTALLDADWLWWLDGLGFMLTTAGPHYGWDHGGGITERHVVEEGVVLIFSHS